MLKILSGLVSFSDLQDQKGNFVLHGLFARPFGTWPFVDNQWIVVFPNQAFEVWSNRDDAVNRLTAA